MDRKGNSSSSTESSIPDISGRDYFDQFVKPKFESCRRCHELASLGGYAPTTIYSYNSMKIWLGRGTSKDSNALVLKLLGLPMHQSGGDQCRGNIGNSPCKEVTVWWEVEFVRNGDFDPGITTPQGKAEYIVPSATRIEGWAADPTDMTKAVQVDVFAEGPEGVGTLIASVRADQTSTANVPGNHGFRADIPIAYQDGFLHHFYVYGQEIQGGKRFGLQQSPLQYTTAVAKPTKVYNGTSTLATLHGSIVAPCLRCHAELGTYSGGYGVLAFPHPNEGTTDTTNLLYQKASGQNHGGGNHCSGNNRCGDIRTWWLNEFPSR